VYLAPPKVGFSYTDIPGLITRPLLPYLSDSLFTSYSTSEPTGKGLGTLL